MELLKISVSKDARIDKKTLLMLGHVAVQSWSVEEFDGCLRDSRPPADNIRLALAYRLRDWQRFEHYGETCRAIATPTKGVKGLDVWVHVQTRKAESVEYSQEPVLQITGNGMSQPVTLAVSQSGYQYNDLVRAIGSSDSLQAFGAQHFFESDLRGLCKGLLEAACVPLWPGVLLVLTPEARERIDVLERLLSTLDVGTVTLSCLSLDNTPANREALARELAEGFTEQLEKLQERLTFTAPNYAALQTEYDALSTKIALTESVLGVEMDCLDAQVAVELGLSAAQAA